MKQLYIAAVLVSLCNGICAMEDIVKLPSEQKLKQRLCKEGLGHFTEITKIDKTLGGKKIYPLEVTRAVHLAVSDYGKSFNNPNTDLLVQDRTPTIIITLLKGHPKTIEALKEQDMLTTQKDLLSITL